MTKKKMELLIWGLIIIGLGAIILGIYAAVSTPKGTTNGSALLVPVSAGEWKRGGEGAKAVLVEYSDFQCPACKYFYGMVKQLEKEEGDKVQIVYRHFPLQQHQFAKFAAIATEAAGKQGKFWEMHDMLFENQDTWSKSENIGQSMVGYATQLGLNIGQFQTDVQSKDLADKVEKSIVAGNEQQIPGTPTFYLNGVKAEFRSYEELKAAVDKVINK
jgi:protein-disulfide isomerase